MEHSSPDTTPYSDQIREEANFWGKVTEDALEYGIPPWVDLRRCADFKRPTPGPWDDPRMQQILFGDQLQYILREAVAARPARVLDLACGSGWLSLELARCGLHVEAMDVSERQIQIARRFLAENPFKHGFGSVSYRTADLNEVVLEPERYDVVTVWGALHHIQNLEHLLSEVHTALRPGGVFLVLDDTEWYARNNIFLGLCYLLIPSRDGFRRRLLKLYKRILGKEKVFLNPERLARFPKEVSEESPFEMVQGRSIIELIRQSFVVEKFGTMIPLSFPMLQHLENGTPSVLRHKYGIVRNLKRWEDVLTRIGVVRGPTFLLKARKSERAAA